MDKRSSGGKKILSQTITGGAEKKLQVFAGVVPMIILVCWCAGCVPIRFTTSPGATGIVLDAATRQPVTNAEIVVSRSTYPPSSPDDAFTNSRPPTVMSSSEGHFSVPSERRLDLYFLPVDAFPRFGLLVVKRAGYQTVCVPFWSHSIAELGPITLTPNQ